MHPLRFVCLVIGAVFLYVAGHLYLYGKAASRLYAPGYIAAEHDWHGTVAGKPFALSQYPEGANDPGPWAMTRVAPSARASFFEEAISESGSSTERKPRARGASRRTTSVTLAGAIFELPVRIELLLLGLGICAAVLPHFVLKPRVDSNQDATVSVGPNPDGREKSTGDG